MLKAESINVFNAVSLKVVHHFSGITSVPVYEKACGSSTGGGMLVNFGAQELIKNRMHRIMSTLNEQRYREADWLQECVLLMLLKLIARYSLVQIPLIVC